MNIKFNDVLYFSILLLPQATWGVVDSVPADTLRSWREAVAIYTTETDDYLETVTESLKEVKSWREKILQEKFEARSAEVEDLLASGYTESIREIESYVRVNGEDSLDDSVLMKLAQLHYEKIGYETSKKMKRYQVDTQAFYRGDLDKLPDLPTPDYSSVVLYVSKLLHKFPNSHYGDSGHYLLAYSLFDEGKSEKAVRIYERMLLKYPFSEFAPEVKWRLAEDYYDSERLDLSVDLYKSLAETSVKFSLAAMYKEGTALFSQGKYNDSAEIFLKLYKEIHKHSAYSDPQNQTIYDETLDYLARLKGKGIFIRTDEEAEVELTQRLADIYKRGELRSRERQTYLAFVSGHPLSKNQPRFMNRVIESYVEDGMIQEAMKVRIKFVSALATNSVFWARIRNDVNLTVEVEDLVEKHSIAVAEYYVDLARKTRKLADFRNAENALINFVTTYSSGFFYAQASFDLAELYYFSGNYEKAASRYYSLLEDPAAFELREESAYGYFLAEVKLSGFPLLGGEALTPSRASSGRLLPPSNPSPSEERFLKAASVYLSKVNSGIKRQKILYRTAEIYYKHNKFEKVKEAIALINKDSGNEVWPDAKKLFAATLDLEKKSDFSLQDNSLSLVTDPMVDIPTLKYNELNTSHVDLIEASNDLREGRSSAAADLFLVFATKNPMHPVAPALLIASGTLFRSLGEIYESSKALNLLKVKYPKNKFSEYAEFLLVSNEVSLLKFEDAARDYEIFSQTYPKALLTSQAYLNAAYLWHAMGKIEKMAQAYEKYAIREGSREVLLQAAQYYEASGDKTKALALLKEQAVPTAGRSIYLRALFAQALLDKELVAQNCLILNEAKKRYQGTLSTETLHAINGCAYLKTKPLQDELLAADEESSLKNLERLESMSKSLEEEGDSTWLGRFYFDLASLLESHLQKSSKLNFQIKTQWGNKITEFDQKALRLLGSDGYLQLVSLRKPSALSRFSRAGNNLVSAVSQIHLDGGANENALRHLPDELYALAQKSRWERVYKKLLECVERERDLQCAGNLLYFGYNGPRVEEIRAMIRPHAKADSFLRIALADNLAKNNFFAEARELAKPLNNEEVHSVKIYGLSAAVYESEFKYELSKLTLEQGLRNTERDSQLLTQKGFLNIHFGKWQDLQNIVDELLNDQDQRDSQQAFLALAYHAMGQGKKALSIFGVSDQWDQLTPDLVLSRYAMALLDSETAMRKELTPLLEGYSNTLGKANYLLGVNAVFNEKNSSKANSYFEKAQALGEWISQTAFLTNGNSNRMPANTSKEEHH